eukprot:TRINITY_DN2932_c0_g1_i1.p1 TRINITY_DN2932_c0_g1~~TRINITY_DN2932_c0_g1_i1.p1  ORF type:complete len:338 (+),score=113.16 TRINITY_DN2932_c0_g1_i1:148-1161(+)
MSKLRCSNSGCDFFAGDTGLCSKHLRELLQESGDYVPPPKPSAEGKESILKCEEKIGGGSSVIQVRLGDMTLEKVDAIVNAANGSLVHASGLAGAILKKGGAIIRAESEQYIDEHGKLDEGMVAKTSAGKLPCKYVFHAVGPMWHDGKKGEDIVLDMAIRNCLEMADENKCKSISIPAISSGIFGMPRKQCASWIYATTVDYLEKREKNDSTHSKSLQEVRFVNFDNETTSSFVEVYNQRQKKTQQSTESSSSSSSSSSSNSTNSPSSSSSLSSSSSSISASSSSSTSTSTLSTSSSLSSSSSSSSSDDDCLSLLSSSVSDLLIQQSHSSSSSVSKS